VSLRFLIDAQLPPGLARRLEVARHQAVHLHDVMSPEATDAEVAGEANRRDAVLVSKDEDFADLSQRGILMAPLLWIRCGNVTNVRLWQVLEPLLPKIEEAFASGDRIVEVR
jgi:predicted nuclease of predicted toxin-antitoxin system